MAIMYSSLENIFEFRMKKLGLKLIEIQNVAITLFFTHLKEWAIPEKVGE